MAIRLRVIENPTPGAFHRWAPDGTSPGDCWRLPERDEVDRECWVIVLPNDAGVWTTTDRAPADGGPDHGVTSRWNVTGTPPDLTVDPSINAEPAWHGSISGGVMS
jgi:hypothetical protein